MKMLLLVAFCLVMSTSDVQSSAVHSMHSRGANNVNESLNAALTFMTVAEFEDQWDSFKTKFSKSYEDQENEMARKKIFAQNLQEIHKHNDLYAKGLTTYAMGINKFTDMDHDEVIRNVTCLLRNASREVNPDGVAFTPPTSTRDLPNHLDWRSKGYVTHMKDQGHCGSCWAFSAVGTLEGQLFRKTGKLVSLSEQNIVDCDKHSYGCHGGWPETALYHVMKNGISSEKSYPYEAKQGTCRYNANMKATGCSGYGYVKWGSEADLQVALATIGPISVAIHVTSAFVAYERGVFQNRFCYKDWHRLNHAVLLVGYGTTCDGTEYWLVKNSWGPFWGDEGYIKMARNRDNLCGIASDAVFPLV